MSRAGVSRMMVVDGERLIGLLSLSDLMKFIALKMELEEGDGADGDHLTSRRPADAIHQSLQPKTKDSDERFAKAH